MFDTKFLNMVFVGSFINFFIIVIEFIRNVSLFSSNYFRTSWKKGCVLRTCFQHPGAEIIIVRVIIFNLKAMIFRIGKKILIGDQFNKITYF